MLGASGPVIDAVTAADSALERAQTMSKAGQDRAALANVKAAVRLYRQLAESQPDVYRPDLAMSLQVTSDLASAAGKADEALVAAREAVEIFRSLATAETADAAEIGTTAETDTAEAGAAAEKPTAAETGAAEAGGAAETPTAAEANDNSDAAEFRPYLGSALCVAATRLHEAGSDEEALDVVREGIHLFDNADAEDLRRHRIVLEAARLLRNELSPDEHLLDEEFDHRDAHR